MLLFDHLPLHSLRLRTDAAPVLNQKMLATFMDSPLWESLLKFGIQDPLLVRYEPDFGYLVETGIQRTLFARQQKIQTLKAFVYPRDINTQPPQRGRRIESIHEIKAEFAHAQTPTLVDILGYIQDTTIQLK